MNPEAKIFHLIGFVYLTTVKSFGNVDESRPRFLKTISCGFQENNDTGDLQFLGLNGHGY